MKNGLYSVRFQTPLGQGAGVVTLRDGLLTGGDAALFYVGTYEANEGTLSASVTTGRHSPIGPGSVFGRDVVHLSLKGASCYGDRSGSAWGCFSGASFIAL
ncbi:hypothetical protein JMJ47_000719 [Methylocystis sp. MJC1]|uniref:GrlR family regulatory protein n=1 Tax=Methylocystis sp. MJC1 TaxID=2654282 RepID=UPI0013EB92AC|nr:hypothetical protein [Methylocystis sp. MJC1]